MAQNSTGVQIKAVMSVRCVIMHSACCAIRRRRLVGELCEVSVMPLEYSIENIASSVKILLQFAVVVVKCMCILNNNI